LIRPRGEPGWQFVAAGNESGSDIGPPERFSVTTLKEVGLETKFHRPDSLYAFPALRRASVASTLRSHS